MAQIHPRIVGKSQKFEEVNLETGRHSLDLKFYSQTGKTNLQLGGTLLLDRTGTREWNIAPPFSTSLNRDTQPTTTETIFRCLGKATLAVDEEFDPNRHVFGLQIWLEPNEAQFKLSP